jgi:hypothetical protein
MRVRYQFTILSIGPELERERAWFTESVVAAGHLYIDLTATGVLARDPSDTVARHMGRSDYLVLIVDAAATPPREEMDRIGAAYNHAVREEVPVLCLVKGSLKANGNDQPGSIEHFVEKVEINSIGTVEALPPLKDSSDRLVSRLIDTYPRPGFVSTRALPGPAVADELARLASENAELRERLGERDSDRVNQARRDAVVRLLKANQIIIQLWERAASEWEKPIEMSMYDFFLKIGPELVVEKSAADANQFIPIGVCELDPTRTQSGWLVPPHTLNLWFTDLMALGLVEPSPRDHHRKDVNQYWSLTRDGREILGEIRRQVLERGGHRNLGFTQEFPIVSGGL